MCSAIKSIQSQQRNHQQQYESKRNSCINVRLVFHFNPLKTFDMEESTANQENDNCNQNNERKNIAQSHDYVVKSAQSCQRPLGAEKSVNHHFDTAKKNDNKAPKNKGVNEPDDQLSENFGLPNCDFEYQLETFAKVFDWKRFSQLEKEIQPANGVCKKAQSCQKQNNEE